VLKTVGGFALAALGLEFKSGNLHWKPGRSDFLTPVRAAKRERCNTFGSFRILLALSVCLSGNGCSRGITRATAATVLSAKGDVIFGQAKRNQFQPVTPRSKIRDGDIVRTSDGGAINLLLVPGALIQVSGNSEIKIEELNLTKDGNETAGGMLDRSARVQLSRGRVSILFRRSDTSGSHFALVTKQTIISPNSDCLFSVWTDGSTTRATCARGELSGASDAQTPVRIVTGYFHQWPTAAREPLAASDEGGAQIDVMASLEAENELLNQAASWQNRHVF
jgi:hypothetical protein